MRHFRVLVQGANVWLDLGDGGPKRYGFFVTRHASAESRLRAAADARAGVEGSPQVQSALNSNDNPVELTVTESEEIKAEDIPEVEPGFAFFEEQDEDAA